jgi:hypothetical protein
LRYCGSCVTEVITIEQELGSRFSARVYKGEAFGRRIISGVLRYVTKSKIKPFPEYKISIDVIFNPG